MHLALVTLLFVGVPDSPNAAIAEPDTSAPQPAPQTDEPPKPTACFDASSLSKWRGKNVAVFTREQGAMSGTLMSVATDKIVVLTASGNVTITPTELVRLSLLDEDESEDSDVRVRSGPNLREANKLDEEATRLSNDAIYIGLFTLAGASACLSGALVAHFQQQDVLSIAAVGGAVAVLGVGGYFTWAVLDDAGSDRKQARRLRRPIDPDALNER